MSSFRLSCFYFKSTPCILCSEIVEVGGRNFYKWHRDVYAKGAADDKSSCYCFPIIPALLGLSAISVSPLSGSLIAVFLVSDSCF